MGSLTLDQLKAEVRSALGGRTDQDSRLTTALNIAQTVIAREHLWSELFASQSTTLTITGNAQTDKVFALPSDLRDILTVRIQDSSNSSRARKLVPIQYNKFDESIPEPERYTTGIPSVYTRFNTNIELWRVPDKAYTLHLRYLKWPAAFSDSNGSAKSTLENKDDLIIYYTNAYLFKSLGKQDMADKWMAEYERALRKAKHEDTDQPDSALRPMRENKLGPTDYWLDPFVRSVT